MRKNPLITPLQEDGPVELARLTRGHQLAQ
jgi:hypothetical protein